MAAGLPRVKPPPAFPGRMAPTMKAALLVATCLLCLPLAAPAQPAAPSRPTMPPNHPPLGASPHGRAAPSPWSELADYTLTVKVPPSGATGTWTFRTFADPADVIVDLDTPGPKGRTRGTILLVGGQAIAAKGFALEPGYETDPLDAAIVNLKILTRLLDVAAPDGPAALKGRRVVDARDDRTPIAASTPSATARFDAPWSLKGTVERVDSSTIAFRLELDAPGGAGPAARARWTFSGRASGTPKGRALDEAMSLAGWTAYRLASAQPVKQKSHTSLRFGAQRLPGAVATLKDLRAALAKTP